MTEMMKDDAKMLLSITDVQKLMHQMMRYRVDNLIFRPDGNMLMGVNAEAAENSAAMEDLMMIGGPAYDLKDSLGRPPSLEDLADAYLRTQLGIQVEFNQGSKFRFHEVDMFPFTGGTTYTSEIGPLSVKLMAFARIVILTNRQVEQLRPQRDIQAVRWLDLAQMKGLINLYESTPRHVHKKPFMDRQELILSAFEAVYPIIWRGHRTPASHLWNV